MLNRLWLAQLAALVGKEFKEIKRDPSSYLVAGVLPIIFLLLFGFGITLDAGILKIVVLNESNGVYSQNIVDNFEHSPWFATTFVRTMAEASTMMRDSTAQGIINIHESFDKNILDGKPADIQIIVDGSEPNNANYILNYSEGVVRDWQMSSLPGGVAQSAPIRMEQRYWYNPTAKSEKFLVPGAITVIMTLIGTLLTSLVFAREWERGTMEALLATPVTRMQLLLGKLIPYFCMGMFSMLFCVISSITIFGIPLNGSWFALLLLSSVFMLSALGQGLLISVCLRGQLIAAEAGLFSGFLPALILSGFVFDIQSMAAPMQALTRLLPATYFNTCLRTIFLAGDDWSIFGESLCFMGLLGGILLTLVFIKLKKRLPD